jgi:hypothetical protein
VELLLEAAENNTIYLYYFGFDRSLYQDANHNKERKWGHTLREEPIKDIDTERTL